MAKYKCQKARQAITSVSGSPLACSACDGEIVVEGNQIIAPTIRGGFWSYPRKATAGFDCPATVANPTGSNLVEVIS